MSHLRQPPFWHISFIPPGFFPRGNAQNLEKKTDLRVPSVEETEKTKDNAQSSTGVVVTSADGGKRSGD